MAASSSNPTVARYDVFISFRGEDTRDNFMSHLYVALLQKKIETYIDSKLNRGEEISPALKKAIEESRLSVIIFSENYASSSWCLDELVHILKCKKENGKFVIPIFYNVEPSHVRRQLGSYAGAFAELKERYSGRKVDEWKAALTTAANLSGWASMNVSPESKLVKVIVQDILKKLSRVPLIDEFRGFVGIEKRMEKIETLLQVGAQNIRIVGIWGMGGIGKTTLASAAFNRISSQFEGCCFLLNIREESNKHGMRHLQNILYADLLEESTHRFSHFGSSFASERLRRKKVLVVLDDVNDAGQLEVLIGDRNCFGYGSRIIVTTRDWQVLRHIKANGVYKVEELSDDEALQLFNMAAFEEMYSPKRSCTKLLDAAVNYAGGIPLALKVLGSFLRCQREEKWEAALDKLKKVPNNRLQNILKTSFNTLDDKEQSTFLDIACFFIGEKRDFIERILNCDFEVDSLVDKSLVTVSYNNKLYMHDLIQEMGREIVRKESLIEPGKRSRLWIAEDIFHVLKNNTGTEAVEGIFLDMSKTRDINFNPEVFQKMYNLRVLKIYNSPRGESNVCPYEELVYFSDKLVYLHWEGYCSRLFPANFCPDNLVELIMPNSRLEQLWNGSQPLASLKKMDLGYCRGLAKLPDLSHASNLITLHLEACYSLTKFPELPRNITSLNLSSTSIKEVPSSIDRISCLEIFDLSDCENLESLPTSICKLKSLQSLYLSGCSKFNNFPEILEPMESLVEVELDRTAIKELHSSIENLIGLQSLHLEMCRDLESVPDTIYNISSLDYVSLWRCSKFRPSPDYNLRLSPKLIDLAASSFKTVLMQGWDQFSNDDFHLRGYNYLQRVPAGTALSYSSLDSDPTTMQDSISNSGLTETILFKFFSYI